jgi:hypothetical protein
MKCPKKSEISGHISVGSNSEQDSDNGKEQVVSAPNTASDNSNSGLVDITETTWRSAVDATCTEQHVWPVTDDKSTLLQFI